MSGETNMKLKEQLEKKPEGSKGKKRDSKPTIFFTDSNVSGASVNG